MLTAAATPALRASVQRGRKHLVGHTPAGVPIYESTHVHVDSTIDVACIVCSMSAVPLGRECACEGTGRTRFLGVPA